MLFLYFINSEVKKVLTYQVVISILLEFEALSVFQIEEEFDGYLNAAEVKYQCLTGSDKDSMIHCTQDVYNDSIEITRLYSIDNKSNLHPHPLLLITSPSPNSARLLLK